MREQVRELSAGLFDPWLVRIEVEELFSRGINLHQEVCLSASRLTRALHTGCEIVQHRALLEA
ncbi:MAG: hypothetical protein M3178_09750 [Pseudomonadota bacterium]|nr:hypothetical protein [Pseudomonadota bacterium]